MSSYTERSKIGSVVTLVMRSILLCYIGCLASPVYATDEPATILLSFKPARCVTLREGQPCYVNLKVLWTSDRPVSVCVFNEGEVPLVCWADVEQGEYFGAQYLYETTRYTLRDATGVELDESTVTVAWVYKSRQARKRWRLF